MTAAFDRSFFVEVLIPETQHFLRHMVDHGESKYNAKVGSHGSPWVKCCCIADALMLQLWVTDGV